MANSLGRVMRRYQSTSLSFSVPSAELQSTISLDNTRHRFSSKTDDSSSQTTAAHPRYGSLQQLGRETEAPTTPDEAKLERVENPHPGHPYVARFTCPEFTSICPVTGQPDFAHLVIDYVPAKWLVESKSLKLYLNSFRSHPDFHEACSVSIARRIVDKLNPTWLRLGAYWYPRGGIPIDVFYATGDPPAGVWIPDQGCPTYRGRG